MYYQLKTIVPQEITSVDLAKQIVGAEMCQKLAMILSENIPLQHRAEFDRILYYMEFFCLTTDDYIEIIQKLSWLYQNNYSHEHRDKLWEIREKLKGNLI